MNDQLEQFADDVRQDEALMAEFQQIEDTDTFVARAVEVAHARGYDGVTEADVHAFMERSRKASLSDAELDVIGGGGKTDKLTCGG